MRKTVIASSLVLSLIGGSAALAHKHHDKAAASAQPPGIGSRSAECAKTWKAEPDHSQTRKQFMAACKKA